jgi:uncharacterized protein YndB with AHSA1/START domain
MLKKIAIGFAVVVVLLVVVIATRPSTLRVERSQTISAPPAVVFALINDLHQWAGWSPWEKLDPNMKRTHEGAPSGVGALYHWAGNDEVGEGRMTITESRAPEHVGIKLEFLKPWEATNTTTFNITPSGADSKVTWVMEGESNFMAKAAGMVMDMDAMIGKDFERGLEGMKQLAEAKAKEEAAAALAKKAADEEAAAIEDAKTPMP